MFYVRAGEKLSLWASQLGWLHSCPKRSSDKDNRSRAEQYGDEHPYTCLPSVEGVEYLTSLFIDSGMASQSGMGLSAITWLELSAFNECGGLKLTSWELSQLMAMSRSYCKWNGKGSQQKEMADDIPYIDKTKNASGYLMRQREEAMKEEEAL